MTKADEIAREMDRVADEAFAIRPLSRTEPHCFAEDKDRIRAKLRKLAAELRNTLGGPQSQFRPGTIVSARGRTVRVERRRRAA